MSHTGDPDEASSLDILLSKYGSSKQSIKLAERADDYKECADREEPSSQFLREIRERAEILSRNAAKSRQAALQNVVSIGSHSDASGSGGASMDLFMDVIRGVAISDEDAAKSPTPPTNDEELATYMYSRDNLLQPVIPHDSTPWTTKDDDDTLTMTHDYYQGLRIEPWGTSTTETGYDDSEDTDSTSEDSLDSDNEDVDDRTNNTSSSTQNFGGLKPKTEVCDESSLTPYVANVTDGGSEHFVEDGINLGQLFRNEPLNQAELMKDTEIDYQGREEAESYDEDDEGDEEGDESFDKDVSNKSSDLNIFPDFPLQTFESAQFPLWPEPNVKDSADGTGDGKTFRFDFKKCDQTENNAAPDAVRDIHPFGAQRGIHSVSSQEDGSVHECLGMRQDVNDEIGEVEGEKVEDEIGDDLTDQQIAAQGGDVSFGLDGKDAAGNCTLEIGASVKIEANDLDAPSEFPAHFKDISSSAYSFDIEMSESKHLEMEENRADDTPSDSTPHKILPSLHLELSSEDEQDATVQQRVSSALDDMIGEVLCKEKRSDVDKADESMLQIHGFDDELDAGRTFSSEQDDRHDEKSIEESTKSDVGSAVKEKWCETRQDDKSVESADHFSSIKISHSSFQEMSEGVEEEDEGTNLVSRSLSPGASFDSKVDRGDEKMMEDLLESNFTEIEGKRDIDDANIGEIGRDDNLHHLGQELQQSSVITTEQSRFMEITYPQVEHAKLKTKDRTAQADVQDQSKETLFTADIPSSKSNKDAPSHSQNLVSTSEKQSMYSKPNHPYAEVERLTTSSSQRIQHDTQTSEKSERHQMFLEDTEVHRCQERNSGGDVDRSSIQISHGTNRARDFTTDNSKTCTHWSAQSNFKSLSQDFFPEQKDGSFGDEERKGPSNVRSLIARFNNGSANASPVESPRSDWSFDWNVTHLNGRQQTRERLPITGSSSCDERTSSPRQHQSRKSSDEGSNDPEDIHVPWMKELRERRKRRERSTVWGKLPP